MRRTLGEYLSNLVSHLNLVEEDDMDQEVPGIIQAIEEAKSEWHSACSYFDTVTEMDLIDHAIFAIEAAERKYVYLLRKAKEMGISSSSPVLPFSNGGRHGNVTQTHRH